MKRNSYQKPTTRITVIKLEGVVCQSLFQGQAGLKSYGWLDQNEGTGIQDYNWLDIPEE